MKNKVVAGFGSGFLVFAVIGLAYSLEQFPEVAVSIITATILIGFFFLIYWLIKVYLDGRL